jgi:hypothetical protein
LHRLALPTRHAVLQLPPRLSHPTGSAGPSPPPRSRGKQRRRGHGSSGQPVALHIGARPSTAARPLPPPLPPSNAPSDAYRQHHDIEAPQVDASSLRQGWRVHSLSRRPGWDRQDRSTVASHAATAHRTPARRGSEATRKPQVLGAGRCALPARWRTCRGAGSDSASASPLRPLESAGWRRSWRWRCGWRGSGAAGARGQVQKPAI